MDFEKQMEKLSEDEKHYCVYIWFFIERKELTPFYVGMGRKGRYKDINKRSETFKQFLDNYECVTLKISDELPRDVARAMEISTKYKLKEKGYPIIDAEEDKTEYKRRFLDGIAKAKAAGKYKGRKPTSYNFSLYKELYEKVSQNLLTVTDAAKQLGVTPQTWYRIAEQRKAG